MTCDPFCLSDRSAALCRVDRTQAEAPALDAAAPILRETEEAQGRLAAWPQTTAGEIAHSAPTKPRDAASSRVSGDGQRPSGQAALVVPSGAARGWR
jgi:hypothetical protein